MKLVAYNKDGVKVLDRDFWNIGEAVEAFEVTKAGAVKNGLFHIQLGKVSQDIQHRVEGVNFWSFSR